MVLGLIIVGMILLSGCVLNDNKIVKTTAENDATKIIPKTLQLGNLCSGEAECNTFCHDNKGRCKDYCANNPENEICQQLGFTKNNCDDINAIKFDYAPVNLDKTTLLLPLGLMAGSHITPVDHHYFQNFANKKFDIEIYSPGSGSITSIQHMPEANEGEDYRIVIDHTCSVSSIFIHVALLSERLKSYAPPTNGYGGVNIPVEAGEIVGYYANNMDYSIADTKIILPGFIFPEHYEPETWKVHTANIYDYFNEPVKGRLTEKSVRTAEPISGKIDYDIEGKLSGNWFLEGSGGYFGKEKYAYWQGHLAIAYDYIDPERIVFSIAGYEGEDSRQFGVKGNSPDPAEVSTENGIIKYELVEYDWITPNGSPWDRKSLVKGLKTQSNELVQGILLVQVLDNHKIKLELFSAASEIMEFTTNVKIYER